MARKTCRPHTGIKEFAAKEKLVMPKADPPLAENRPPVVVPLSGTLRGMLSAPVPAYLSGRQGEAGPAQIPSGLCGVNSRGLIVGGIFTPHFERSEIVVGPPAEPREFRSDIFKQTPPIRE